MKTEQDVKKDQTTKFDNVTKYSVKLRDILDTIEADTIVMKMDIEGYECKALQPEVLKGVPMIPFIFIEWHHIANNDLGNCPGFQFWVKHFYDAGYKPYNPET